ncbi:hypothetical protein [Paenibacillus piscarius]|nr:hypothetical protein [Paenibacillus piscarius]
MIDLISSPAESLMASVEKVKKGFLRRSVAKTLQGAYNRLSVIPEGK